jgi:thiol-disulfide isomerase/thioredoxin
MRVDLSLFLLSLLALSACAPSAAEAPPPNVPMILSTDITSQPGMPDRPDSTQEIIQPYFREDTVEAIGATGRPQLVVFWAPSYETGGCIECEIMRTSIQELEAEFWDRVDFVYLNQENDDTKEMKATLGIPDYEYRMSIILLSSKGDMIRRFYDIYANDKGLSFALNDSIIRSALDKYLSEQEGQT